MPAEIINLLKTIDKGSTRSETDRLYDTSDRVMAERFGFRVLELMGKPGADVKHTARLAATFGARALATDEAVRQLVTTGRVM